MNIIYVLLAVGCLACSIVGFLSRDWRWFGGTFFVSLVWLILMFVHAR